MSKYRFDIVSISPEAFSGMSQLGVVGRALKSGVAELHIKNPRDFTKDTYHKVDDEPYGGGAGMVLKPEPFFNAFDSIHYLDDCWQSYLDSFANYCWLCSWCKLYLSRDLD